MVAPAGRDISEASPVVRQRASAGLDDLFTVVYDRLHELAHNRLRAESTGHTLCTTALVHETYLRLLDQRTCEWRDRAQFFALASLAMRRILVDHARRHRAARRGGGPGGRPLRALSLDEVDVPASQRAEALIALDEALDRLASVDERMAKVVECRFFAGLTEVETASVLGMSRRTVAREWAVARGWLYEELRDLPSR